MFAKLCAAEEGDEFDVVCIQTATKFIDRLHLRVQSVTDFGIVRCDETKRCSLTLYCECLIISNDDSLHDIVVLEHDGDGVNGKAYLVSYNGWTVVEIEVEFHSYDERWANRIAEARLAYYKMRDLIHKKRVHEQNAKKKTKALKNKIRRTRAKLANLAKLAAKINS